MTVTKPDDDSPRLLPTSREINLAIDTLRRTGADPAALRLLETWNAHRLVERAQTARTHEELANLFVGLPPLKHGSDASFS
jgi:hypothetical protein